MVPSKRSRTPIDIDEFHTSPVHDTVDKGSPKGIHAGDSNTWQDLLAEIQTLSETDTIHKCDGINLDEIVKNAKGYRSIARKQLNVFPFKGVHPCWHRLYTDTSILQAIEQIQAYTSETDHGRKSEDLDEVIRELDMAMIMSGGYGREDMMQTIYTWIDAWMTNLRDQQRNSKKVKVETLLPDKKHSVPKLQFPVRQQLQTPSLSKFEKCVNELKEPVVLTNILKNWPAVEKWKSKDFWLRCTLGGRRLVPVEIGRSYVDKSWSQKIMPFGQFLEQYIEKEDDMKGYLAQFDLFRHIPGLNTDIMIPDYCYADAPAPDPETPVARAKIKNGTGAGQVVSDDEVQKHIWFGPAWTISQLHHDPYHNIFCQVVGTKYIRLYSPQQSTKLYPYTEDELAPDGKNTIDMSNTSTVDIGAMEISPSEDWDEKWPGLSQVPYQEVVLEAGQALYIPVGWWHYVRSCSVGISVSFWWN